MKGLLLGLFFAASHLPPAVISSNQAGQWKLNGDLASDCVLAAFGNVHTEPGAQLSIHCDGDSPVTGNVMLKLPADHLQYKRITITADVDEDTALQPVAWIKSLHDGKTLLFDSDVEQSLWSSSPASRTMTAVVDGDASSVNLGFMLHGKGSIQFRNVHVHVSSDGEVAAQAQLVLNEALDLIRKHSVRDDVNWTLLNTQAQHFAAGARDTSDVYPVIRYILQKLGDQRSMLLAPETSRMLNRFHSDPASTTVKIYSLPDGANLVLASNAVVDKRVANNWP